MTWDIITNPPFDVTSLEGIGKSADWEMLKRQLSQGTILTGRIFARTSFGVFFDAGHGFPVRMNITDFGKPEGNMKWPDDYPALGSEICGQFNWFDNTHRQLVVIRLGIELHPLLSPTGEAYR